MKKRENFPQKNLGHFFRGGRIQGDVCGGGLLGNKRPDRGKKKFRGPEIFGGDFLGKCQKRGGKTFWWFQKVVGIFLGVTTIFWGRIFRGKKKNPRGDSLENFKKNFKKNLKEKNWGGEILGVGGIRNGA